MMEFNNSYKALKKQCFSKDEYRIVPIRYQDRLAIMKWRNEQVYHLRQSGELTIVDQDYYFENIIAKLFEQDSPKQLLFSYLKNEECIGYGGLVHINWIDQNAEISFIMNTELEKNEFQDHWSIYLGLIEEVAFQELNLHKIFTYAFDVRPHLYKTLLNNGYVLEATLKEHCFFEGEFIDIKIHTKLNHQLYLRKANVTDVDITFDWATNPLVRAYSLSKQEISQDEHIKWFKTKLLDAKCLYFITILDNQPIGSVRLDIDENMNAVISYLLDPSFYGQGLGTKMLMQIEMILKSNYPDIVSISGVVIESNIASKRIFEKLGYSKSIKNDHLFFQKRI